MSQDPLDDGRLWVTWEIRPVIWAGYSWQAEAFGPDGFGRQALGQTSTMWGARRKVRRHIKWWRKEVRRG